MDTTPWISKYRPNNFDEIVYHDNIKRVINNFIKGGDIPNLLFYGLSGTGKTSMIKVISKQIFKDDHNKFVLEINASEERGIETIRNKVVQFVSILTDSPFKMVILDEVDEMTYDAQIILKKVMDRYNKKVRYCLICNYIKKIIPSIISRCCNFKFSVIDFDNVKVKLKEVIEKEKIKIDEKSIETIIRKSNGDLRKSINIIQSINLGHKEINIKCINDTIGCLSDIDLDDIFNMIIKKEFYECYKSVKKIINGYSINDLVNGLYERIIKYDIDEEKKMKIIEELSNFEYITTMNDIQLMGIIGCIKKEI